MNLDVFNNREIASLIWLFVILAYILYDKKIRASFIDVIKAFCHWKILVPIILMIVYISGIIGCLFQIGLWTASLLKDSILWLVFTGFVMLINYASSKEESYFKKTMVDNLKVVMIIEFLVNTYTFSLVTELILLPFMTLIIIMQSIAKTDEKYIKVEKLMGWIQGLVGLVIFFYIFKGIVTNFDIFSNLDTLRQFILAPILSFAFLPFIYLVAVVSTYELLFIRLDFGSRKSKKLKNYAKFKVVKYCLLNLKRIKDFLTHHAHILTNLETKEDVDIMIKSLKG